MTADATGLKEAARRGVVLGDVGHLLLVENQHVRVWKTSLQPGETLEFHFHRHPHLVFSTTGGRCERETIFGDREIVEEPADSVSFIGEMRPVQRRTNKSDAAYVNRVVELRHVAWTGEAPRPRSPRAPAPATAAHCPHSLSTAAALEELLIHTEGLEWVEKSLPGLYHKMLWRNEETEASVALIKFDKGVGIPEPHLHASNQLMFCLSGRYRYVPTGITLTPGSFYCNPKGSVHGPTIADETSIFLEIYDGPHYPHRPSWYDNDEDAS